MFVCAARAKMKKKIIKQAIHVEVLRRRVDETKSLHAKNVDARPKIDQVGNLQVKLDALMAKMKQDQREGKPVEALDQKVCVCVCVCVFTFVYRRLWII